jgi:hypothetical protein
MLNLPFLWIEQLQELGFELSETFQFGLGELIFGYEVGFALQ